MGEQVSRRSRRPDAQTRRIKIPTKISLTREKQESVGREGGGGGYGGMSVYQNPPTLPTPPTLPYPYSS
ncbi:MAG: hypothetical protein F6K58_13325 [Symploca sp. SIO2E9]|nr:hypothetical protein [Symploca sp. SIO2E9]